MRSLIVSALAALNIPVYWIAWVGQGDPPEQYIVFYVREKDALFGGDEATETQVTTYVALVSNTDDDALCTSFKAAMRNAGFRLTDELPIYDPDTQTYQLSTIWGYVGD